MAMTTQVGLVSLDDSGLVLAHPADDLRGLRVLDPCHHRVGEVDGLIIDEEERRARLLVVASGGILGLGRTERLVPVDAVTRIDADVHLEVSHEQVHSATHDPALELSPAYHQLWHPLRLRPVLGTGVRPSLLSPAGPSLGSPVSRVVVRARREVRTP